MMKSKVILAVAAMALPSTAAYAAENVVATRTR
jgi:hypothetical protein